MSIISLETRIQSQAIDSDIIREKGSLVIIVYQLLPIIINSSALESLIKRITACPDASHMRQPKGIKFQLNIG